MKESIYNGYTDTRKPGSGQMNAILNQTESLTLGLDCLRNRKRNLKKPLPRPGKV